MSDAPISSIRLARPADAVAVTALLWASYPHLLAASYDGEALSHALPLMTKANPILLASGTYYAAEDEQGNLVGCGGWTTAPPGNGGIIDGEAHIRHFAAHPDRLRRGIGTALLARCFTDARRNGVRKLHCFSTLNAERFYKSSGFETIKPIDVPMGPGVMFRCLLMSRELT